MFVILQSIHSRQMKKHGIFFNSPNMA